jgi:hypothetical protein
MKRKVKHIAKSFFLMALVLMTIIGCGGYNEEVLDTLNVERVFSPLNLTAKIRNRSSVELSWTVAKNIDHYVVEFSADDASFSNPSKVVNVSASELPLTVPLIGETLYSIRVKGISSVGLEDSKWSVVEAQTLSEQIFIPVKDGDIQAKSALFRWLPNSDVTKLVLTPGDIEHVITASEKIAGIATITGLDSEVNYTASIFNNTKKRGVLNVTTLADTSNGIVLQPTDDLSAKIAAASSGTIFYLSPGDYKVNSGEILLNKSITIRGVYPYDKPLLHVKFKLNAGVANFSLIDLDLSGYDAAGVIQSDSYLINLGSASSIYGNILINGCKIHDFQRSLMYASVASSKVNSFTVQNSIVSNTNTTAGADFIDFRATYVNEIVIKTSTFNTCSAGRDFVRVDASSFTGQGLNTNVLIDECTFYNTSNIANSNRRILYVRNNSNTSTVKNCIFAKTTALHTNQAASTVPVFSNNNYFEAPAFKDATIISNKPDASGSTFDPQFADVASGNFTVGNGAIIDNLMGDPRWRK